MHSIYTDKYSLTLKYAIEINNGKKGENERII
jgi:hypothetical protein